MLTSEEDAAAAARRLSHLHVATAARPASGSLQPGQLPADSFIPSLHVPIVSLSSVTGQVGGLVQVAVQPASDSTLTEQLSILPHLPALQRE